MDKLTGLLKEHQIGEWCKRAAWIIVAIGLIRVVLIIYSLILQVQQANVISPPISFWALMLETIASTIAESIFFFFILYVAGAFIRNFISDVEGEEEGEEDERLAENEEDEIMPGQFSPQ